MLLKPGAALAHPDPSVLPALPLSEVCCLVASLFLALAVPLLLARLAWRWGGRHGVVVRPVVWGGVAAPPRRSAWMDGAAPVRRVGPGPTDATVVSEGDIVVPLCRAGVWPRRGAGDVA